MVTYNWNGSKGQTTPGKGWEFWRENGLRLCVLWNIAQILETIWTPLFYLFSLSEKHFLLLTASLNPMHPSRPYSVPWSPGSTGHVLCSVISLLWHHGLQPARLCCPWNFSGRNTGVGRLPFPAPGDLPHPGIEPCIFGTGRKIIITAPRGKPHVLRRLSLNGMHITDTK